MLLEFANVSRVITELNYMKLPELSSILYGALALIDYNAKNISGRLDKYPQKRCGDEWPCLPRETWRFIHTPVRG